MKSKKILVICASGIGNTILFTPTLKALRENFPHAKITFLVTKQIFAEPVRGSHLVDEIISLDGNLWQKIKTIINLRREKFDYSITAFPSNRWQFNVFAFLAGAKSRITHSYKVGKWRTLSFLQNKKIPAVEDLHDVEQNLNLLKSLGIKLPKDKQPIFHIDEKSREKAKRFWKKNHLEGKFVVGIHPGSGGIGQETKRWPKENFAELADKLIEKKETKILVFGGPEEKELKESIKALSRYKEDIHLINTPLKQTAALIEQCNLFISNDSGLMHIAVAVKSPKVIGIFGPTNHRRTAPYRKNCYIIRKNFSCGPCLRYPFHSTSSKIECRNNKCLRTMKVQDVIDKIYQFIFK